MKKKPVIIAHRGASGYLPEHTLEGKAMAHAMGADYLEQDVVLTKDNRIIVVHDIYLDTVSNVADIFPENKREDGRFYAIDFTLEQIKKLNLHERIDLSSKEAVYPDRFPLDSAIKFTIPTLEEEIEMIIGMNRSTGKNVGLYPEIKAPQFHNNEGSDIAKIVMDVLNHYEYNKKNSNCYIQCFDPGTLRYLKDSLKSEIKQVQLIGENDWDDTPDNVDYNRMLTPEGLDEIAEYADAVGPWMNYIAVDEGKGEKPVFTDFVKFAHKRDLHVHVYTFRKDQLPSYAETMKELLNIFFIKAGVDGIFTDFTDIGIEFLKEAGLR